MGFMLLQYEFQRANREVNICQRKGVRINNQLTRATKRIEKMTSVFDKAKTALNKDWDRTQNAVNQALSNCAMQAAQTGNAAAAAALFNGVVAGIRIGGVVLGSLISLDPSSIQIPQNATQAQITQAIQTAVSAAVGQANQIAQQLIENARDIDEAKLEAKQDAQMAPLAEKEADIQAEKSLNDVLTDLWTERKENAKGKLPDAIKDSMSGFGLK